MHFFTFKPCSVLVRERRNERNGLYGEIADNSAFGISLQCIGNFTAVKLKMDLIPPQIFVRKKKNFSSNRIGISFEGNDHFFRTKF